MPKKSSQRWLKEHFSDPYVKQAQLKGLRSRAAFKLIEMQKRDQMFKPGMVVVDLGAAPGGWSQVATDYIKPQGKVIAVDLLPMPPLERVDFIQGDFTEDSVVLEILTKLKQLSMDGRADWVISDMAPNMSGNESIDVPRSMYLAELAVDFAIKVIRDQGGLLIKVFQGAGFDELLLNIKQIFKVVHIRKPKASRGRSREVYVLAREKKLK